MPKGVRPRKPLMDRFLEKVSPEPNTGCWLWTAGTNHKGYGEFGLNKKMVRAHRFSYEIFVGPIPNGLQLDHLCRVRCCVNPDHLDVVTQKENWRRGESPPAINSRKTICKNGHPLTGENLYIEPTGKRRCRQCAFEYLNQWRMINGRKKSQSRPGTG